MFENIRKWWSSWIGDRDAELAIRQALKKEGLRGDSAKITNMKLVAVRRPGWSQLYAFDASVNIGTIEQPEMRNYFGLMKQDERYNKADVCVLQNAFARKKQFEEWADGMHRLRNW